MRKKMYWKGEEGIGIIWEICDWGKYIFLEGVYTSC